MRVPRCRAAHALLLASLPLASCLVAPPAVSIETETEIVRADSTEEARRIVELLETLRPKILLTVPDSRLEFMEVWVQDRPTLYGFPRMASTDAEGLWAESHDRILLGRDADNLERTLAHELVHAALGDGWKTLPGSLEEGLCDHVSATLTPNGAARLRAGRLSSAALACGGLRMQLDISPRPEPDGVVHMPWSARIVLSTDEPERLDAHLEVFSIEAGLSSSTLPSSAKRGYYGLSYLVVDRIVERFGLEALHDLCVAAAEDSFDHIPTSWLLLAAELDREQATWRKAAASAFTEVEVVELLHMFPDFVVDALVGYLMELDTDDPTVVLESLDAELRVIEGTASVRVMDYGFIRAAVLARIGG